MGLYEDVMVELEQTKYLQDQTIVFCKCQFDYFRHLSVNKLST